jgi:hypothetical protein
MFGSRLLVVSYESQGNVTSGIRSWETLTASELGDSMATILDIREIPGSAGMQSRWRRSSR